MAREGRPNTGQPAPSDAPPPPVTLPYRRIALVLTGGGAMGAYEVGVLKVLEQVGIRPSIMAGVSIGAINAVLWLANHFRTEPLVRVWSTLRASSVGMHWVTLIVRAVGTFIVTLAFVQILLTIAGSPDLSPGMFVPPANAERAGVIAGVLDVLAWLLVGTLGVIVVRASRSAEDLLARMPRSRAARRAGPWYGVALVLWAVVHIVTWVTGVPWPHRFSALLLLMATFVWLAIRTSPTGDRTRRIFLRLLPETGGRGLWGSESRRRVIRKVVEEGDPQALVSGETHLIISACSVRTGQMGYFINWPVPSPDFQERIVAAVGTVIPLREPDQVIEAALASSAIPVVFEPVSVGGHEFVDGGIFSNQPLHAVLADGADAIIAVLVTHSSGPQRKPREPNLFELAARLLEIANWRDLQTELRGLPPGWSLKPGPDEPARICVVEPDRQLPGGLYGFSPRNAAELQRRGERDARRALIAAGWLPEGTHVPDDAPPPPKRGSWARSMSRRVAAAAKRPPAA